MRFYNYLLKSFMALVLTLFCGAAMAGPPGCEGKMWNPIVDIDFRLMGGIKIAGIPLLKAPEHLSEPPNHKVSPVCFCKDGWKTGFGLGMLYWLPTYLADVARQAGCIGFLNGINILPGFITLSSGQEYSLHSPSKEGVTNMQIHWAYADITAIAGKEIFESCNGVSSGLDIAYLTEIDFIFQNDVYSAMMTPQVAIISSNALLSAMACGYESVANTLGAWQDMGVCGWKGTRLPLSANAIAKDMAQVSNMDVMLKYLTRSALVGSLLCTMGKDVACKPKWSPFYDPFQHRFQWAFPAKASTRYNVDVVRWGLFIKPEGMLDGIKALFSKTTQTTSVDTTTTGAGSDIRGLARQVLDSLPKPLNYPTKEAGYMHVWEAKTCCLMVLTIESVARSILSSMIGDMGGMVEQAYTLYTYAEKAYNLINDPVGGALGMIGEGIASVMGSAFDSASSFVTNVFSGAASVKPPNPLAKGAGLGIAQSAL